MQIKHHEDCTYLVFEDCWDVPAELVALCGKVPGFRLACYGEYENAIEISTTPQETRSE